MINTTQAGDLTAWAGATTAHPFGLLLLLVCLFFTFYLPREKAILPLIVMLVAIPSAQRIVLITVDFSFIRILILATLARSYIRKETGNFKFTNIDLLVLIWMVWDIISFGLLLEKFSASITRTGYMVDAVGAYFLGRIYLATRDDIQKIVIFLGMISAPMALIFLVERTTGRNLFAEFGGVPEFTLVREGRLRCQGPFSHPIMAGVFWAGLMPWIIAMWYGREYSRFRVMLFAIFMALIVVNTASSTPVMSVLFALIGIFIFPMRRFMPILKWVTFAVLFFLHFLMDKPVWHILARVNIVGGSTGWHRYNLIEKAVENLDEWWLIGIQSTGHWGWGLQDVTNQYVLEGVRGGLLGLILFSLILLSTFSRIGKKMRKEVGLANIWFLWMTGVMLFAHAMNFLAVSYFGQMVAAFFFFLGAAVSISTLQNESQTEKIRTLTDRQGKPYSTR